jgi:hypothetical protein
MEWNREPRYESNIYTHLIFDKPPKAYIVEKVASSTNVAGNIDYLPAEN